MSTLRDKTIHKNDILMDKVSKVMYFVVAISTHSLTLRHEGEGDDRPVEDKPKHYVNKYLIKVDPLTVDLLYNQPVAVKDGTAIAPK